MARHWNAGFRALPAQGFFPASGLVQTQGNQQASYVSRFIFPGKTPFAVYFQYGARTPRTAEAICWAMPHSPPASIFHGWRATSI